MTHKPDHVKDNGNEVHVGKTQAEKRCEECDRLKESVNWDSAPDWARLLYLKLEQMDD